MNEWGELGMGSEGVYLEVFYAYDVSSAAAAALDDEGPGVASVNDLNHGNNLSCFQGILQSVDLEEQFFTTDQVGRHGCAGVVVVAGQHVLNDDLAAGIHGFTELDGRLSAGLSEDRASHEKEGDDGGQRNNDSVSGRTYFALATGLGIISHHFEIYMWPYSILFRDFPARPFWDPAWLQCLMLRTLP